ncbi:MAG: N-acyl homoserine lactonase family protein [Desulfobacteraceae bacterium]|nr:N-acyl homoserine lactonase family protein [Desulfobacteraceae bacterium]
MKKSNLSIHPLDLGTLVDFEKSVFTLLHNQGVKIDAPCLAWVILGAEKKILVDTGPCNPDWASRFHRTLKKAPTQEIDVALGKLGLSPLDIDFVIFTHLHWDHCFNLDYFPRATFLVQKKELEYAVDPLPFPDKKAYGVGIPEAQPPWMQVFGRIITLDGDQEILQGIQVIHLPGHTPGFQGVVVETEEGPWAIAGDTVPLYENWEGNDTVDHLPGGVYQSLDDYYSSLKKLERYGDKILSGHDEKVLKHTSYPFSGN